MNNLKENREFIIRYFNAISGAVKTEALMNEYTTDDGLIEHTLFFESTFPKYELFIEEMMAEDNKVLVRGLLKGVNLGEFNGAPPTGREIELPFSIRFTIDNGKIVDHWLIADQMLLMQQLGIAETPAEQAH